ncbi:hypothetical protein B0181_09915, partial [Moraxella caviae]
MSNIINFTFENLPVRIVDRLGNPWFLANDVCDILEIQNTSDAIKSLDDDEKAKLEVSPSFNLGLDYRVKEINIINESGLYILILRSRKAMQKGTVQYNFRKWVTSEVLPTIRRTGSYHVKADRATAAQLQGIKDKVHRLSFCFRKTGSASNEMYNLLRVKLSLRNIADISENQIPQAHAILDAITPHCEAYGDYRREIDEYA